MNARRVVLLVVVAAFVSVPTSLVGASDRVGTVPTVGSDPDLGDASIRSADEPGRPLEGGDASTPFVVSLPAGATCPGDSAHDQWRVQTFMVPDGVDIARLHYGGIGPDGPDQFALFTADATQRSWDHQVLPPNAVPGAPSPVPEFPAFSFAAVSVVPLTEGRYRIGAACTLFGETAHYWDASVDVSGSSDGVASAFRWTVVPVAVPVPGPASATSPAPSGATGDHSPTRVLATVAVVLLVAVVSVSLLFHRRARPLQPRPHKEY